MSNRLYFEKMMEICPDYLRNMRAMILERYDMVISDPPDKEEIWQAVILLSKGRHRAELTRKIPRPPGFPSPEDTELEKRIQEKIDRGEPLTEEEINGSIPF